MLRPWGQKFATPGVTGLDSGGFFVYHCGAQEADMLLQFILTAVMTVICFVTFFALRRMRKESEGSR